MPLGPSEVDFNIFPAAKLLNRAYNSDGFPEFGFKRDLEKNFELLPSLRFVRRVPNKRFKILFSRKISVLRR